MRLVRFALAGLLLMTALTEWRTDLVSLHILQTCVLGLFAGFAIHRIFHPEPIRISGLLVPLAGAAIAGAWQLVSASTEYPFATSRAALGWFAGFALVALGLELFHTPAARSWLCDFACYSGFVLAIVSTIQMFTSGGKVFWIFPTGYTDFVMGPFTNRDHYCALMELIVPIALYRAVSEERRNTMYAGFAAAMIASVIASASRAGSVLVILELFIFAVLVFRRRRSPGGQPHRVLLRLAVFAVLFTAVAGWEVLWIRLKQPDPYRYRREMALSCLEMVRARPFSGFGLGTFEAVYPAFASFDTGQRVNHAHNDYAEFAAEGGLPLLALFLTVVFWSLRTAWRVPWTIGVVAVFAHALVDYPLQTAAVWAWTLTLLSAGVGESGTTPAPGSERRPAR